MHKVAMVGDRASVQGFKALGLDVFPLDDINRARQVWNRINPKDYGVIIVTESVFERIRDLAEGLKEGLKPVVLVVPSATGPVGLINEEIRNMMKKAVGTDIMKGRQQLNGSRQDR
ncbi:V/A-type H+/Na+-transporting ATPase subunit F [Candidatus Hakubella thermalkaliphila]|uniref:V/A-type H+/Na+-transporting ATPase subunit F n=3 Tax=Candidatus Hakubella thermalkaliphila TaxID=2754717 RepID=A0A6V8Q4Y1_9ACTN|nr:V-type ATP synthase subunit F [Candidatus Hakubella thermalkaliphila]MBT9170156.1 V-type sodium ATPase subunit G [Actinomycetota bacterium]GFP37971.1 V/A-type H+/Na+-transporting ATPase subunit F [Candidatus Hakubella thermalkaliphila]GFP41037.1 V/A-type H+/Na+-transporting ATPase subunit F [Candidatus Hakubella thermalkaliphila]